jgi:hypothetical protein
VRIGANLAEMFPAYDIKDCFLFAEKVKIDIKPRDPSNRLAVTQPGTLKVAVLTRPGLVARRVARRSVRFGLTGAETRATGSRLCDLDRDGDRDLVLRFRKSDTGLRCGAASAALTARTIGGRRLGGSQAIRTVGC